MENKLYTAVEVAEILGMHVGTVRKHIASGRIKKTPLPFTKTYLCKYEDIMEFKEKNTAGNNWLSAGQVAKVLNISIPAVNYLVGKGVIKKYKVAGTKIRNRFNKNEVFNLAKNYRKITHKKI